MIEPKLGEIFIESGFLVKCKSCFHLVGRICDNCIYDYKCNLKIEPTICYCDICNDTERFDNNDVYFIKL